MIHRTLEWLYIQVMEKKIPTVTDVVSFYSKKWDENYSEDILIVNKYITLEDYFNKGVEFLVNYYMKHQPFKDNTIAIESRIEIDLDKESDIKLVGFIDRIVDNIENNEIEIHDYKTSNSVLSKEKIENSRQLALYSLAIKERFGKEKNVSMVWHFLAHDTRFYLRRTNEELEKFKKEVVELIKRIETTKQFPPTKSRLCDWCQYKDICPVWKTNNGWNNWDKKLDTFKSV